MKKSLVLAMALTLGVAASAYAANPFSDVPANHWAYGAVAKLAAEGVIDGMGNGRYEGNRNMTRYEMAQIVAKAMAKGVQKAELKKLATEFAQELNALGVRTAKLEQKVQISGEMRLRYRGIDRAGDITPKTDDFTLRTRLHLNGTINKNWSAYMMLENTQNMKSNNSNTVAGGEGSIYMRRVVATGKYDNFQLRLGRVPYSDKDAMLFNPGELDGMVMDYNFGNVKATALYGRFNPWAWNSASARIDSMGLALDWQATKEFNLNAAFYNHKQKGIYGATGEASNVWDILATYKVNDWKFSAMYIGTNKALGLGDSKSGYALRVGYGNFSPAKKGSYLIQANYFKIPVAAFYGSPYQIEDLDNNVTGSSSLGAKGWSLVADYAIERNIRLHAAYIDAKGVTSEALKTKAYVAYATFYF